ncbi:polysaccharide deacetylase family protein [Gorillibacterium timonense]|uniref:polysaccharide deacetylase family protein n=1 Tax=Gorillibacterium timonense TaxID=1689269 RepID=UPI000B218198|nr:polysaccharide deacetylase family protein [Gorillibacterium timonense]
MRKPNERIAVIAFCLILIVIWSSGPLLGVDAYVSKVKQGKLQASRAALSDNKAKQTPQSEEALRERIQAEAAKLNKPPVNARIDRVWKAIPGYNGLEVDVEKTIKLALAHKTGAEDPLPFVYNERAPKVNLTDLETQPIYKGNPDKPMASLMINVAWGEEYLPAMLETLLNENVHATFFFDGSWLSKHVELAKQIGSAGHELSNHAYSHPNMSELSRSQAVEQIAKTQALLKDKLGVTNTLFAPPSGDFNQQTVWIAKEQGLTTVLWTVDTVDWKKPEPSVILRRINSRLEPGSLILMHPTASTRDALPGIIRMIKQKGLALGTVSELLSTKRVSPIEWMGNTPLPGISNTSDPINVYGGTP